MRFESQSINDFNNPYKAKETDALSSSAHSLLSEFSKIAWSRTSTDSAAAFLTDFVISFDDEDRRDSSEDENFVDDAHNAIRTCNYLHDRDSFSVDATTTAEYRFESEFESNEISYQTALTSTEIDFSPVDFPEVLYAMRFSDDELEVRAAEMIIGLLSSDDERQNDAGNFLLAMLNEEALSSDAIIIAGVLSTPAQVMEMLDIYGSAAGIQIMEMMRDPDRRDWVGPLLDSFTDENLRRQLLGHDPALTQLSELFEDADQQELAFELLDLINSENEFEVDAARQILSMMNAGDGTVRYNAALLTEMLLDPHQRPDALVIAGSLSEQQIATLFALSANPAYPALLEMLHEPEQRRQVATLLNLVSSEHAADRQCGERLLTVLTGAHPEDARSILCFSDPEHRHLLTAMIVDNNTAAGARQILSLLTSGNREDYAIAENFLNTMNASNVQNVRNTALLRMLSDENQRAQALSFMRAYRYEDDRLTQVVGLVQADPRVGRVVAEMLRGSAQERQAVTTLLDVEAVENALIGLKSSSNRDGSTPLRLGVTSTYLTQQLLGDASQRQRAVTLMANLNAVQVGSFLQVSRQNEAEGNRLLRLIESGNLEGARILLNMAAVGPFNSPRDRDVAHYFLDGLNRSETNTAFTALTSQLNSPEEFRNMYFLLSDSSYRDTANAMSQMLANPARARDAHTMLSALNAAQIRNMFALMNDSSIDQQQTRALMNLVGTGNGALVLDMLGSSDDAVRRSGRELMARLTNDRVRDVAERELRSGHPSDRRRDVAEQIIRVSETPAQANALLQSLDSPETREGTRRILRQLDTEDREASRMARSFVEQLAAPPPRNRQAQQWLRMVGSDSTERHRADVSMSMSSWADAADLIDVLNNRDARNARATAQVRRIVDSSAPDSQELRNFLAVFSSHENPFDPRGAQPNEALFSMLNDPTRQAQANTILRIARTPELARDLISLSNIPASRVASEQAVRMMQSGDPAQVRAAENWVRTMNAMALRGMHEDASSITRAFTEPQTSASCIRVLSNMDDPAQNAAFLSLMLTQPDNQAVRTLLSMLESGDRNRIAGVRSLLNLRIQDLEQERNVPPPNRQPSRFNQVMAGLNNPEQAATYLDLLSVGPSASELGAVTEMIQNRDYAASVPQVIAALRDPSRRTAMSVAFDRLANYEVHQLFQLSGNPEYRRAVSEINSLLSNPDQNINSVQWLLMTLNSEDEMLRRASQQMLNMLNSHDADEVDLAIRVFRTAVPAYTYGAFLSISNNPGNASAARELLTVMENDVAAAMRFLGALQSDMPSVRQRANWILSLLNNPSTVQYGLRLI